MLFCRQSFCAEFNSGASDRATSIRNSSTTAEACVSSQQKKKPLRQTIFESIRDDIVRHRLNAGEKLLEADLARRFSVSRTPIREALHLLERDGLITYVPNSGATVKKNSLESLAELFDIRAILEAHIVETVTKAGITKAEAKYLDSLLEKMKKFAHNQQLPEWEDVNRQLHGFFVGKCGNRELSLLIDDLNRRLFMADRDKVPLAMFIGQYMDVHAKIAEAAVAGSARRAGNLMRQHILDVKRNILRWYER